jgi:hypothetical protein
MRTMPTRFVALLAAFAPACFTSAPAPQPTTPPVAAPRPSAPESLPDQPRILQRTASGGVISLNPTSRASHRMAAAAMAAHCGGMDSYTVLTEGEEVVDQGVRATSTPPITEWRLHYECNAAP